MCVYTCTVDNNINCTQPSVLLLPPQEKGKEVGVVTTTRLTHATPGNSGFLFQNGGRVVSPKWRTHGLSKLVDTQSVQTGGHGLVKMADTWSVQNGGEIVFPKWRTHGLSKLADNNLVKNTVTWSLQMVDMVLPN